MEKRSEQISVTVSFPAAVSGDKMRHILEWVDFRDRRPDGGATVLLAAANCIAVGCLNSGGRIEVGFRPGCPAGAEGCGHAYTHWATLPPSPNHSNVTCGKAAAGRKRGKLGL